MAPSAISVRDERCQKNFAWLREGDGYFGQTSPTGNPGLRVDNAVNRSG
jgi:hypothetical protein